MAQLAVIIPAYNENSSLPQLMERLDRALRAARIPYVAIMIDDHSTDGTYRTATRLQQKYPLSVYRKQGVRGKAQSILEGLSHTRSEYVVMIDADLQYPPEAIPEMFAFAREKKHGVVVARRKVYDESTLRRIGSRGLALLCGRLLHGFECDIQSGLKLFKRDIARYIDARDISPWSLDLPLLHTAKELGHTIGQVEIDFVKRAYGDSKLSLIKPTLQIFHSAVKLKFRRISPEQTLPTQADSMTGAGVRYRGTHFVTHSTLHHSKSALTVITDAQRSVLLVLLGFLLIGLGLSPLMTFQIVVAILSFVYFVDVIFNFFLILKSLHSPPEISPSKKDITALKDQDLPIYTILCPLYKEAHVIPQFVEAISALDWPKNKLEVMLLLEEDDTYSVEAVRRMKLPSFIRSIVVPDSSPKTKPKACNYGLNLARGEYVVIYDAEDKPAVDQLKKAYLAFQMVGPQVKCLQAKLNYYNPNQNWLTRLFTAEYSLWFDVILTGLQSIGTTIPLGGTSNHFRTADLLEFEGWDPFNVTEDCDLGVRLFKKGAQTAIIDSTTLEEANSNFHNWIRQRSRWIKGYMQTYLLHMRDPMDFASSQGIHAILFQLTVGGKIAFILINPILWVLTIAYFALYRFVGPTIESLYPTVVFYMAVTSLIFGNFMFIYYYMIGAAKREHWGLMKWIYFIPFYWLMVSIAGAIALYQLIVKPHYWEKTIHGLHLQAEKKVGRVARDVLATVVSESVAQRSPLDMSQIAIRIKALLIYPKLRRGIEKIPLKHLFSKLKKTKYREGIFLVVATMLANVVNMLTSLYIGRELKFADFGVLNTLVSIYYLFNIPISAFSSTVNHKTAFLMGKYEGKNLFSFWNRLFIRAFFVAVIITGFWISCSSFIARFFNTNGITPILIFSPLWILGILASVNKGYLKGRFLFSAAALITVIEPITRLLTTIFITKLGFDSYVYLSLPISVLVVFIFSSFLASRESLEKRIETREEFRLPKDFFLVSLLAGMTSIAFFSLDNVLVAHFLGPVEAGKYAVIGLVGKMILFTGGLTSVFITPIISRYEGRGEDSSSQLNVLLLVTTLLTVFGYICLGIILPIISPYFFGEKINAVRWYLPFYGMGITLFTISQVFVSYYLAKRIYAIPIITFLLAPMQIAALYAFHLDLNQIVAVMLVTGVVNLLVTSYLHLNFRRLKSLLSNLIDLLDLFGRIPKKEKIVDSKKLRILILNWRDTKHVWSGGAEVYIHEIAKEFVKKGHVVTLFCGNDGKSSRNQVIDGVQIIRRGGFYTVYIWAFFYYVLRFRGEFDVIVDSENGIPFLTPIYARVPVFLLIHHIHQEVFREHLSFPLSYIARFIEGSLMPMIYKNSEIITVSESSKAEILKLGLGSLEKVKIVNPGISKKYISKTKKTLMPTLCYLGRLKPYKNIDRAIVAFNSVLRRYPTAVFRIIGTGESGKDLKALTSKLGIDKSVLFLGQVNEEEKTEYLSSSWVCIQPSMIEGWGITVIEANACGTPVVASNTKGLRDSIKDGQTGILVNPADTQAFSEEIVNLFTNEKLRKKMSYSAAEWSKNFSWETSAGEFMDSIQQHVDPNNSSFLESSECASLRL